MSPIRTSQAATPWLGRGLLFIAAVLLLEHARPLLLPVTIAIVFTLVLSAPVRAMQRRGIHEYIGTALVIAAILAAVVVVFALIAAPAAAWWSRAPAIVHELIEALQGWRDALFPYATPAPLARGPAPAMAADPLNERLAIEGWIFTRLAIGNTLSFAVSASATVILLYFMLATERWLVERTAAAIREPRRRALVLAGLRQAQRDIGLFISTMSLVNVALGIATGLALWAIGLPNPVLWGTTTAVLAFIPYLGPLLIAVLLLLAGSVTFGTGAAMLGPPAAFLLLHGLEANFLSPLIMGHRLRLSPVFVFLSVMVWGWLWGVAGAFIAVPLLLGLRAVCKRSRRLRLVCVYLEGK
ncbi:MAG: AI-2E family transporter [Burkholderiales bacterium]|nr:AI-2E family transporter [Burkholderiales bacterium]